MGTPTVLPCRGEQRTANFLRSLLEDLRALEWMLEQGLVEAGPACIGAEQEAFLVAPDGRPAPVAPALLEALGDPRFVPEVGTFNLEANLSPRLLGGRCLAELEAETRALLERAERAAAPLGAGLALTGILPSLERGDLVAANLSPGPRFAALERATLEAHGGEVRLAIRGIDDLSTRLGSMLLDACPTSFQVHLQVAPDAFAQTYNAAQLALAPALAAAANSPLLLGQRLWHETRVPLVEALSSFTPPGMERRGAPSRTSFGTRWVEGSVLELLREDALRHRPLLAPARWEPPFEALRAGRAPTLRALTTHNGTVWRWNRPCYGLADGRAHLRIECRALPAGPTVPDQVANAALWLGLVLGLVASGAEVRRLPFAEARANFAEAARSGLGARLTWLDGRRHPARALLLGRLLPLAREGLLGAGVDPGDVERYLGLVEARVRSGRTGARWLLESFGAAPGERPGSRGRALARALRERSLGHEPVHAWAPLEPPRRDPAPTLASLAAAEVLPLRPCDPPALAAEAAAYSGLPVVPVETADGRLVGAVLAADLPGPAGDVELGGLLSSQVPAIPVEATLAEAASALLRSGGPALLLVEDEDRLVGVVTAEALLGALRWRRPAALAAALELGAEA